MRFRAHEIDYACSWTFGIRDIRLCHVLLVIAIHAYGARDIRQVRPTGPGSSDLAGSARHVHSLHRWFAVELAH